MTKECTKIRKTDLPDYVSRNDRIIAEGIIDSSVVHICLMVAAIAGLLVAVLVLSHVRFSVFASFCLLAFILSTVGMYIGYGASHEKIQVTKTYVFVRNIFGKEIYLRTDSITAVGLSSFGTVYVLSDACKMNCMFVKNREEVVFEIRKLVEGNENESED